MLYIELLKNQIKEKERNEEESKNRKIKTIRDKRQAKGREYHKSPQKI